MSFSQFTWKIAMGCSLAVVAPAVVSGQSSYAPQSGEHAIAGELPGDQVKPRLSLNARGGYLVWQDNAIDGDGWGISGQALDSSLSGIFSPFRINVVGKADQENPQVALLNNGGAVFVWQGGQQGFQHIFARFLTSSNTWGTSDVMVNASTKFYQANPAVAVLNNGNVVIVYASFNADTMQDVYGQIFSPGGQQIGGEFQLNQFTPYNQRTPAVASLNNGGFVTAWVSEQQRAVASASATGSDSLPPGQLPYPSVDIYSRLFDSSGLPTVGEFLVNVSSNVCANPSVAVASDGSFMFAWGEKDSQVLNNSWDVYARPFSISGVPAALAGSEQRVNTQLYGDQYSPQISALGTDYLMVWTSMGQDGDHEGVYGQLLGRDGSPSGGEFRVNTTTLSRQKEPAVASDHSGRFLAAWTGFAGGNSSYDLYGQIYVRSDFVPSSNSGNFGAPAFVPGDLVLGHPGSDPSGGADFVIVGSGTNQVLANVPPPVIASNAFALAAGNYNGLFTDTNGVTSSSSGYFSATTTAGKTYTAKILLAGVTYSFSGAIENSGRFSKTIVRKGQSSLNVAFRLDLFGGDQVRGTVSGGNDWGAALVADRQVFGTKVNTAPYAGKYTMAISGNPGGTGGPGGSGFGTLIVGAAGNITWSGTLADGTAVSQNTVLSKSGVWPLYVSLSGGQGLVESWVRFDQVSHELSGQLAWIKPASSATYFPAGFTSEATVSGSSYIAPVSGARQLSLSGGGVSHPLTYSIQIGPTAKVTNMSSNKLTLTITSSSGAFMGSATDPATRKTISFKGVLLEGGAGAGFFLGPSQSGQVYLNQAP